MDYLVQYWWILPVLIIFFSGLVTVNQGFIDVVTMFGKYRRIMHPGLNFKIPLLEQIRKRISIQNRSVELEFQAVTADQANVYFKSMLLYAVQNEEEETIKKVAFKFISERDLMLRVVSEKLDPEQTHIRDVMTSPVVTVRRDATADDALKLMIEKHIRHLPIVDRDGKLAGMISIRNLLHDKVEDLTGQLDSLEAYFTADGCGG